AEGADILDVGGESTRPGAEPVSAEEELHRVLGVIEGLAAAASAPQISIDTSKAAVAEAAIAAGAGLVNDVSAFRADRRMAGLVELCQLGRPILIGTSRKQFLGRIQARAAGNAEPVDAAHRLAGTLASNVLALERGASVFRVHDVAPVRDALAVAAATLAVR